MLKTCIVEGARSILGVKIMKNISDAECHFNLGPPTTKKGKWGTYGSYGNVLWTNNGCGAEFFVCHSGNV